MSNNNTTICNFTIEGITSYDPCAIGVIAGGGALIILAVLLCIATLCCCKRRRRRRNREAHDKETSENIRMTSISTKRDDHSERGSTHEDNSQLNSKSTGRTTNDKKVKGQKQTRHSRDKDVSIDRTASEGASGKAKPSLTYKRAQNQENRESTKRTSEMYRSASYSVVGGVQKEKETKRLPAIPGGASHAGDKHDYDKVKGADGEKPHKYANIDLSEDASTAATGIMEPKYDEVDTESTKKGRKTDKSAQKNKPKGATAAEREHFYHTLEESQLEEGREGDDDEEYSSPKRKALVVTKVKVHSKTGKGQVMSTEESATVKGTKTERAKSYSEKKSSKKGGKKKDPDYEEPNHNTLPNKSKSSKESTMQKGNLAAVFDDPMYIASMNSSGGAGTSKTTPTTHQPPARESSPKRASAEMPQSATPVTLRTKSEQTKQPVDDPKYDEPNEKKPGALTKKEIYSSKLFDDPKYEEGFPAD